jgi:UDP-3-O-[3-hydroxymyristoyl] N-acetylglucosamine deacetylase
MICQFQRTIKNEIEIKGIGLHTGEKTSIKLIPAKENEVINFIKNGKLIPARIEYANKFDFSTSLSNQGETVNTVEHLMAALYFTGIDNIYIEVKGSEIPILDGSAYPFVEAIKKAGIKSLPEEKIYAVINKEIEVKDKDKFIKGKPYFNFKVTYHAVYNNQVIGNRKFTYISTEKNSFLNVYKARTYCFFEEVEYLKKLGLAKGGSLENAVVFKDNKILNPEGLRFEDEPVRHKLLDLIGDLYLLGNPLIGEIYSYKGGHKLNADFVRALKSEKAFTYKYASEVLENLHSHKLIKIV